MLTRVTEQTSLRRTAKPHLMVRIAEAGNSEELAVIPHAGGCGGQSGNWLSYPDAVIDNYHI